MRLGPRMFLATTALAGAVALAGPASAGIISIATSATRVGTHAGNLVVNGSFETGNDGTNQNWTGPGPHTAGSPGGPGVAIPGWTASYDSGAYGWWGSLGFAGAPCVDGVACLYFGNWHSTVSPARTFHADGTVSFASPPTFTNDSASNAAPVVLSQVLSGLTIGDEYLLDFWTSGEGNDLVPPHDDFPLPGVFGLNIGATDSAYLTVPAMGSEFLAATSIRYIVYFSADATSETLSFTNWGHVYTFNPLSVVANTELVLDDVIVNHVPEPATVTLFGFGILGLGAIRRRKAAK